MRNEAVSGMVEYTGRAFLQDAQEAMGGDIIRALIEMITNCDDSYGSSKGKIRIEIEHCRGPHMARDSSRSCQRHACQTNARGDSEKSQVEPLVLK